MELTNESLDQASAEQFDQTSNVETQSFDNNPVSLQNLFHTPVTPTPRKPVTYDDVKNITDRLVNNPYQGVEKAYNPYLGARPKRFDTEATNYKRYYNHPSFDKLGFDPNMNDVESYYNNNSSVWDDSIRMMGQFDNVAWSTAKSAARSWQDIVKGDFFSDDELAAKEYGDAFNIGMSSRGGVGGFVNNLALSTAFVAGIALETLAEEAAIAAGSALLSPATGGGSLLGGAALMGTSALKGVKNAFKLNSVMDMSRGAGSLIKNLKNIDNAKEFYDGARNGWQTFGKGAAEFLNPFSQMTELLQTSKGAKGLVDLALSSKGAGAFYRDVRNINFALSESKLEGGSSKIDMIDELVKDYFDKNGSYPEGDELENIYKAADGAAFATTAANLPLIYYTNKITFDGLFNFKGFKGLNTLMSQADNVGSKIVLNKAAAKTGGDLFEAAEDSFLKNIQRSWAPKTVAGNWLNYFKRNLSEGLQESLQEATAMASENYYKELYTDPSRGGMELAMTSVGKGIGAQFSAQGLETFASGFFMGGLIGAGQKFTLQTLPNLVNRVKDPVKYEEYKTERAKVLNETVAAWNAIYKDPAKYFDRFQESFVVQNKTAKGMEEADNHDNANQFYGNKQSKEMDALYRSLANGNVDVFLEGLQDLKGLKPEELAEAFNMEDGNKAVDKLNELIKRTEVMKKRYDLVEKDFPNPFDPKKFKKNTPEYIDEVIKAHAFNTAKKHAVLSQYSFDRTLERMEGILSDVSTNKPVGKASASDFTVLFDPQMVLTEIDLLENEIKGMVADSPAQKAILKNKKTKLKALESFQDIFVEHLININDATLTPKQITKSINKLQKAYSNYVKQIASIHGDYVFDDAIKSSFQKLNDFHFLKSEADNLAQVINALLNPSGLVKHASTLVKTFSKLYEAREEDTDTRVKKGWSELEFNELVKQLADIQLVLDSDEVNLHKEDPSIPFTKVLDIKSQEEIDESDPRFKDAMEMIESYMKLSEPVETETIKDVQETITPVTETEEKTKTTEDSVSLQLDAELEEQLRRAYDTYRAKKDPNEIVSFEDFVNANPTALALINTYNKRKKITSESENNSKLPVEENVVSETDIKIADIEKRRKTTFDNFILETQGDQVYEYYLRPDGKTEEVYGKTEQEVREAIHKKYDAEYEALGIKPPVRNSKSTSSIQGVLQPNTSQVAQATDTARTEPVTTSTKSLSDIEAKKADIERRRQERLTPISKENPNGYFENTGDYKKDKTTGEEYYDPDTKNGTYSVNFSENEEVDDFIDAGSIQELKDKINAKYNAELAALENTFQTNEVIVPEAGDIAESVTVFDKIQAVIDDIKSVSDFPKAELILTEIVINNPGEVSSVQIQKMLDNKKAELMKNISISDIKSGNLVTLSNGKKAWVIDVTSKDITIKIRGTAKGLQNKIAASDIPSQITMIEDPKQTSTTEQTLITPEDQATASESRDVMAEFTANTTKLAELEKAAQENPDKAMDDLLDSIGCDI